MIFLLALSIFHIFPSLAAAEEFNPLGRGAYLPRSNLVGNVPKSGFLILNSLAVQKCTKKDTPKVSTRDFNYYKDTRAFYSYVADMSGLGSSLKTDFSLGFTLEHASRGLSAFQHSVTGNSLLIKAFSSEDILDSNCLLNEDNFDPNFLDRFQKLPVKIKEPWIYSAWKEYEVFLTKYAGSHVVTSTLLGSSINQMVFAETVDSYTPRDFKVRSCLSFAGPTNITELGVSLCSGIGKSEISQVSKMSMSDYLVVRGGTDETRNELIKHRSAELIEEFMNEAKTTKSVIQYKLTPMWNILQTLYAGKDHNNFVRAINLEYYYLGLLNYGCDFISSGGQVLQMFNFTKDSSPEYGPQYECSLAPEGCHHDNDCRRKAVAWCSCRGPSCVRYRDEKLDYTCEEKTTAEINREADWDWHGCELKLSGCYCSSPSEERTTVWKLDPKNALYQAHHVSLNRLNQNVSKGKDEL